MMHVQRQHRFVHLAATALAVLGLFVVSSARATIAVGPSKACRFSTIQAAINAAASIDSITVDPAKPIYHEKLNIAQKGLTISSCPCDATACRQAQDSGTLINAVISGAGGANAPVLTITTLPSNFFPVKLDHLTIQDGHSGSIDGGGISYRGSGRLTLTHSTVFSNRADYGAGINFTAIDKFGDLFIEHDTFVTNNTATQSGGGVRIEGFGAKLHLSDKNTWIAFNEATHGLGGGIEVINGAEADIGSPGFANLPAIYANKASYGGGVAASGASLFMFTTDPLHPIAVDNNTAFNTGGGIYVATGRAGSLMCLQEFQLTNNIAKEGSAFYSDETDGLGSFVLFNTVPPPPDGNFCPTSALHAVFCDPSVACNIVQGNDTFDVLNKNSPTNGAAILLQSGTTFLADRLDVRDNRGGYAVRVLGSDETFSDVSISNGLFANNEVMHEMVLASDGYSHLALDNCLFTHNKIGANRVIAATDVLALNNSIIDQGAIAALAFSGNASNLDNEFNIAGNIAGLIPTPTVIQGTPTYFDAAHGDFRLFMGTRAGVAVRSLGIDFAPAAGGGDIRNLARDKAVTTTPLFGVRDLGPYELQSFEIQ